MNIEIYTILTALIVLTAACSYINYRFIKLPSTVGIILISILFSLGLVIIGSFYPAMIKLFTAVIKAIDFENFIMEIIVSFLLFAGALQVNTQKLKEQIIPIISFSTISVLISTVVIGIAMYFLFEVFSFKIQFIYCLLFGALISLIEPIAVLGILKKAQIRPSLETKITGESLFNNGVAIVVYIAIFEIARLGSENAPFSQIAWLFLIEVGGGTLWGVILGYIGIYLLRSIDNYQAEVLITLAMVMGGYSLALIINVSGPVAIILAGMIAGNKGMGKAASNVTKEYLKKFWKLIDEILNAALFILIGLEILIISVKGNLLWISLCAIPVILFARWVASNNPVFILSFEHAFEKKFIAVLTWGGLRGGISVALALSLPSDMHRQEILSITYAVVVFSIIVQGLTIGKIARKLVAS